MLMEDASVDSLTIGSMGADERTAALDRMTKAIEEMQVLLARVRALEC